MAQACAALRHHPGELLDAVAADVEARPSDYDRDDWTNIVWALTRLGRFPGHLYALLAQEVGSSAQLRTCVSLSASRSNIWPFPQVSLSKPGLGRLALGRVQRAGHVCAANDSGLALSLRVTPAEAS